MQTCKYICIDLNLREKLFHFQVQTQNLSNATLTKTQGGGACIQFTDAQRNLIKPQHFIR